MLDMLEGREGEGMKIGPVRYWTADGRDVGVQDGLCRVFAQVWNADPARGFYGQRAYPESRKPVRKRPARRVRKREASLTFAAHDEAEADALEWMITRAEAAFWLMEARP